MSDTHLGSRQYMRDDRERDFYEAFRESMEIAIREKVDFIVHTGDLFDSWSPSNRALAEFKETALKMREAGIPMFLIMGDHDRPKRTDYPAAKIFDFLGIKLLGENGVETHEFTKGDEKVLIAGISNMKGYRRAQLVEEYSKADALAEGYENSILLSHQGITGFLIDDACEAKYEELPKKYSYLAFGHVHDCSVRADRSPVFSYAGSTELKSINEIQAFLKQGKSVNLVTLDKGEPKVERVPLTSVRYQFAIESDFKNYRSDLESTVAKYESKLGGKAPLITLKINGDADKEAVRHEIAKFRNLEFRPPEFIATTADVESMPGMDTAADYIKAYFKDDPRASEIAQEFYAHMRKDREEGIKWLKEKLGIRGETG